MKPADGKLRVATLPRNRMRIGRKGWHALALAAGVAGALALNELAIAVVAPPYDPRQQVQFVDPDGTGPLPPLGRPNSSTRQVKNTGDFDVAVHINRFGFRDAKDISTAGPGDLVLVGDSFAFGWGVEEGKRLSDELERRLGRRVFNIGVTGNFDTYDSLLRYAAAQGAQLADVIVCVAMESDIERYRIGGAQREREAAADSVSPRSSPLLQIKAWLMSNSSLYFMTTAAVHHLPWLESLAVRLGLVVPNLEGIHRQAFDAAALESSVARLVELVRPYGATVVLLPSRGLWHGTANNDVARTHETFAARLKNAGIKVVDLRPAFESKGAPLDYHFRNDAHWNTRGHALAAEIVARQIRQLHGR